MSDTIEDPNTIRMSARDAVLAALRVEVEEVERLRAERDKLYDVLLSWDALSAYQFTGSRDAMNALQQCADETQAIFGTNETMEEQK